MKICFVLNQLYKSGGIERTIQHRIKALSENHEIFIITMDHGDRPHFFDKVHGVSYTDLNCDFQRNSNSSFKKNWRNVYLSITAYSKLQAAILRIKPDITVNVIGTHSLFYIPNLFSAGITVLEFHSSFSQSPVSKLKKKIMARYDYGLFLTEEEKNSATFMKNKIVIPNPINTVLHPKPYVNKANRIIAAGRVAEVKGFDRLIKAWSLIAKKYPDWKVEIYGDNTGTTLSDLNSLIKELNIADSLQIKEATADIIDLIEDSKIYAMTSHFECFPMVLLEAMSVGTVITAFDCPTGPRNIITPKTGFLVENDNISSFSKKLTYIIENENRASQVSIKAHKHSFKFSLDKINSLWNKFLIEIEA